MPHAGATVTRSPAAGRPAVPGEAGFRVRLRRQRGRPVLYFYDAGGIVAAAGLRWESRLLPLLRELGFERVGENEWGTSSLPVFLSGLVFYAVAQSMQRPGKLARLRDIVEELELLELRFWGHCFAEAYRRSKRRGMYRPARAFKTLYGLAR